LDIFSTFIVDWIIVVRDVPILHQLREDLIGFLNPLVSFSENCVLTINEKINLLANIAIQRKHGSISIEALDGIRYSDKKEIPVSSCTKAAFIRAVRRTIRFLLENEMDASLFPTPFADRIPSIEECSIWNCIDSSLPDSSHGFSIRDVRRCAKSTVRGKPYYRDNLIWEREVRGRCKLKNYLPHILFKYDLLVKPVVLLIFSNLPQVNIKEGGKERIVKKIQEIVEEDDGRIATMLAVLSHLSLKI